MPEMRFDIEWPDGIHETCYSPSLVIKDYFAPGQRYDLAAFLESSRIALNIASARVQEKFGFPCSRALAQLAKIESTATRFSDTGGDVLILSFHDL